MLVVVYLLNAALVAAILVLAFLTDHSTPKRHRLSWLVILIASLFWFIAIPVSFLELVRRSRQQRKGARNRNRSRQSIS